MVGFFKKLLGGAPASAPFGHEALAEQHLAALPPCAQYVVVASDRYAGPYKCEVVVPAAYLAMFVSRLAQSSSGSSDGAQAARISMPRWLGRASENDGKSSYLPPAFLDLIDAYVPNFVKEGAAVVACKECGGVVNTIASSISDQTASGHRHEWTSTWRCENGHLLYKEEQELRFF